MPAADTIDAHSIKTLVDAFYAKIQAEPVLGPVFAEAIDDWGPHLTKMYTFWGTVILGTGAYSGSPMQAHMKLPRLEAAMFDRWLKLFLETVDEVYAPEPGERFKVTASRMAHSLKLGVVEYRPASAPPLRS